MKGLGKHRNLNIKSKSDIILLYESIHNYGCFTQMNYEKCLKSARSFGNANDDLEWYLEHKIKPLIGFEPKEIKKQIDLDCSHYKPYSATHKACEFQVKQGCIQLGDLILKSTRINKTPFHILSQIKEEFCISQDSRNRKSFHFVPYNDLTRFLDCIKKVQDMDDEMNKHYDEIMGFSFRNQLTSKDEEQRDLKIFLQKLDRLTECFFMGGYYFREEEEEEKKKKSYQKLYDTLRRVHAVPEEMTFDQFYSHIHPFYYKVPTTDVKIEDFKITFSTTNIQPIHDFSWIAFLKYLNRYTGYGQYFDKWTKHIRKRFDKKEAEINETLKENKTITIKTVLTKKSFQEAFSWMGFTEKIFKNVEEENNPGSFNFPAEFLTEEMNYDYSYYEYYNTDRLVELITSEPFHFPQSFEMDYNVMKGFIAGYEDLGTSIVERWREDTYICMTEKTWNEKTEDCLRCSKPIHAPFLSMPIDERDRVIHFKENFNHFSDKNSWGCSKHEKSIVQYREDGNILKIIPAEKNYATYNFSIDKERIDIDYAAFVIIKCFSSPFHNKRERFELTEELRNIGFTHFWKY